MGARLRLPRVGDVEIYTGLMGAGKSYCAVREMVRILVEERRPVYTNLPIRWRVMRQYLRNRGGEELAALCFPLTEEHFRRFVDRQHKRMQLRERVKLECQAVGQAFRERAFAATWREQAGEDVVRGVEANWIDPLAVIIIDEVHHWFPQQTQAVNKEFLQRYLTMLRHHLHRLVVISQNPMQVDISFRRLASYYVDIRAQAEEKLAWGLRSKHLGVRGIRLERFTADVYDDERARKTVGPLSSSLVFERLPHNRWVFRLYDSFTHVGGVRAMQRRLREVRREAGLSEDGGNDMAVVHKHVWRWRPALAVGCAAFVAGTVLGGRERERVDGLAAEAEAAAVVAEHVDPPGGVLAGIVGQSVVVDGRIIKKGGRHDGYELAAVGPGRTVWVSDARVWLWEPGREPRDLGKPADVVEAFRSGGLGGEERGGAAIPSAGVGAPEGLFEPRGTGGGGDGGEPGG